MMRESVYWFMRRNRGFGSAAAYRLSLMFTALVRLVVMGPMMILGRNVVRHGSDSWRKWFAILRWSIGIRPRPPTRSPVTPVLVASESK
jgi:hypothetical protein